VLFGGCTVAIDVIGHPAIDRSDVFDIKFTVERKAAAGRRLVPARGKYLGATLLSKCTYK